MISSISMPMKFEIHLFNMIAQSKVSKESIDGLFTAAVEDAYPTQMKAFQTCALPYEMTQPAELSAGGPPRRPGRGRHRQGCEEGALKQWFETKPKTGTGSC